MNVVAKANAAVRGALQDSLPAAMRGALQSSLPASVRASNGDLRTAFGESQPAAYVEMAIGLAVLVIINLLFFRDDSWGFFEANPHPFWFVVIPIAARYGAAPGYAVGGLAALLYMLLLITQPRSIFAVDIFSTQAILPPVLFLVAGAALGELRESQKRSQKDLATRYDGMEADLEDVAQRYLAAVEINREMQRRIVSQTATVTTLYQAAKALDQLEIEQLCPAILELVATFVEADACALYLRQDGKFVLKEARPEHADFQRPRELDTQRGIPAIVLSEQRTVTIRDVFTAASPTQIAREPLLIATPLIGQNHEVIGILTVERMPFLRLTPSAVKLFSLLGDWASSAFQTALQFQETRDRNIVDELTGAYSASYINKRLSEELARARMYKLPLSVLAIRIDRHAAIPPVKLPSVLQALSVVFRRYIREIDVLGKSATDDGFVVLLPQLTAEESQAVGERISREVEAFAFQPFDTEQTLSVSVAVASLGPDIARPEDMIDGQRALPVMAAGPVSQRLSAVRPVSR
jgi:polysaccharide biosynthesis protein PelD